MPGYRRPFEKGRLVILFNVSDQHKDVFLSQASGFLFLLTAHPKVLGQQRAFQPFVSVKTSQKDVTGDEGVTEDQHQFKLDLSRSHEDRAVTRPKAAQQLFFFLQLYWE